MAIGQVLLFLAVVAGLLSIVPLATWAATGSWRQALHATRGYLLCMGILGALALLGWAIGFVGVMLT